MAGTTNTSRTLAYLKTLGWEAGVVERYLSFAGEYGQRKDLFGVIDIIAITDKSIAGIQSCGSSFAEHNKKILSEPLSLKWIEKGGILMLIGWRKVVKKRGSKVKIWSPRIKEYTVNDFKEDTNEEEVLV